MSALQRIGRGFLRLLDEFYPVAVICMFGGMATFVCMLACMDKVGTPWPAMTIIPTLLLAASWFAGKDA